jgi:ketosteroid isomerase-like protein
LKLQECNAAIRRGVIDDADWAVGRFENPFWKETSMTEHSLWRFSRALHRAINERRPEELAEVIDDDVDWTIYGPIDMFPFLGARRGKPAVLEVLRQIADNVRVHRFDRETVMLGVDSAASMLRYSLTVLDSNKPISLRVAHFAQFKAGRLSSIRVLIDSFDLVEQALGRPIHLPRMISFA